jgi:RimJ/RimL family protein N-acetyltransferase
MEIPKIYATAECENIASVKVLQKCGLSITETFEFHQKPTFWFEGRNPSKEIK